MHQLFVIPTLACPASCKYCFSSNKTGPVMSLDTLKRALSFFYNLSEKTGCKEQTICFHGGEPLVAGIDFYENVLPAVKDIAGDLVKLSMQSNLWNLTDAFCDLFKAYNIDVGTSLDGPEHINDFQRGTHYFKKTMNGIHLLHKHGIGTGCISTFTNYSAPKAKEVFDFFLENSFSFSIHSAVKPLKSNGGQSLFLSSKDYANLLIYLLELYLENADKIRISTLDTMIRNVSRDESGLCTFSSCIGDYLAVAPDGELYPCNRFIGDGLFSFGNLKNVNSFADIEKSQGWKRLKEWQKFIDLECSDCLYKNICNGGCPYAGFSYGGGKPHKDPYCSAYKKVYKYILDRGTEEFFSEENLKGDYLENKKTDKSSFFKKSTMLRIMSDDPHPYEIARASKQIVAAALFGVTDDVNQVVDTFLSLKLAKSKERAYIPLKSLYQKLKKPSFNPNNLYLHITDRCNLSCNHCYAKAENSKHNTDFPFNHILSIITQAKDLKFRKVIITGGEPLLYPEFNKLLVKLLELRKAGKIGLLVLRTNLASNIKKETFDLIGNTFDQIIVSLDGSEEYHDKRRGEGSYQKTISNLKLFNQDVLSEKVQITSVFGFGEMAPSELKKEKKSVYEIKEKFYLADVRFRPLLPIGRAKSLKAERATAEKVEVSEWVKWKYHPRTNCGLGQVLMINPDGNAYPCHVFENTQNLLGNVLRTSISDLVNSEKYKALRKIGVDSEKKCKNCPLRYLCGGSCKVWANTNCDDLYDRAAYLLLDALRVLGISKEKLREFGYNIIEITERSKCKKYILTER